MYEWSIAERPTGNIFVRLKPNTLSLASKSIDSLNRNQMRSFFSFTLFGRRKICKQSNKWLIE